MDLEGQDRRAAAARTALRTAVVASARAFLAEQRALADLEEATPQPYREFLGGEVACLLHVSPRTGEARLARATEVLLFPPVVLALESGTWAVPHALAALERTSTLDEPVRLRVLSRLLDDAVLDEAGLDERTPGELGAAAARSAVRLDPEAAVRRRREAERDRSGVRARPTADGMARLSVVATAVQVALVVQALAAQTSVMTFDEQLTQGQREVAALLHALGCERVAVQAVVECPVRRAVGQALAGGPRIDVRLPVAVALGLSNAPAELCGFGPIDAEQARALLPSAALLRALVDERTGEVLTADAALPPTGRGRRRTAGLRERLVGMATSGGTLADLSSDGYVPGAALARLVDLRDGTSVFPGDATPARRCQRDHRVPWPRGRTSAENLQLISQRWHRAKHAGWATERLPDGTDRWTSPGGGVYLRRPTWTAPPPLDRPVPRPRPGPPGTR